LPQIGASGTGSTLDTIQTVIIVAAALRRPIARRSSSSTTDKAILRGGDGDECSDSTG
jgi:hypothetical protein